MGGQRDIPFWVYFSAMALSVWAYVYPLLAFAQDPLLSKPSWMHLMKRQGLVNTGAISPPLWWPVFSLTGLLPLLGWVVYGGLGYCYEFFTAELWRLQEAIGEPAGALPAGATRDALQPGGLLWLALVAVPIFNFFMALFYIIPRTLLFLRLSAAAIREVLAPPLRSRRAKASAIAAKSKAD